MSSQINHNPYAAPDSKVTGVLPSSNTLNFDGKHLILLTETELPNCCIKCGEPADIPQTRTFKWMNPWWYLTILISLLITIVASLIVSKKLRVTYYLCDKHLKKRTKKRIFIWTSFLLILGLIVLGNMVDGGNSVRSSIMLISAIVLMIVWLIIALVVQGDMKVKRATLDLSHLEFKRYLFSVKGVSDSFLAACRTKGVKVNDARGH